MNAYKHFLCCDKGLIEGFITTKNALVWLVEHLAEAEAPNCNIALTNTKLGLAGALAADIARNQKRDATMSAHRLAAPMAVLVLVLVVVVVVMVPLSGLAWQTR